jgi:RNase P subunit RPR2
MYSNVNAVCENQQGVTMKCMYCGGKLGNNKAKTLTIVMDDANVVTVTLTCEHCKAQHIIEYHEPYLVHYYKED